MATLFEQACVATGLSELLAPGVIRRACKKANLGGFPEAMNRVELRRCLPYLAAALRAYMEPEEVLRRLSDLQALCRSTSGAFKSGA